MMPELQNCPVCGTPARKMVHDGCYSVRPISPRWIPVEERLPEAKFAVLGYGLRYAAHDKPDKFPAEHVVYTRGEDEGWFTYWDHHYVKVTHWMPLPESPSEKKGE